MKQALSVLNSLEAAGTLKGYAIGGAIAALFYTEAIDTEDLDVFVLLSDVANSLSPLSEIYDVLREKGYVENREHMMIEGIPIQFLPAYNPLIEEAVRDARKVEFEGVITQVPTPEHLMAIMLQTGRAKDRLRFEMFQEQVEYDNERLAEIVSKHSLQDRYTLWTC